MMREITIWMALNKSTFLKLIRKSPVCTEHKEKVNMNLDSQIKYEPKQEIKIKIIMRLSRV